MQILVPSPSFQAVSESEVERRATMKTKTMLLSISGLALAMSLMGSDCINSPFVVAVNLDAVSGCFDVNPGDGSWNDQTDPIVIQDLIDENFQEDITGYRLYDIRVRVSDNYPDGTVMGDHVSYSFDFGPFTQVITSFQGQSSQFKGQGVSLLDPQGLITFDQTALNAFVSALNDPNSTPQTIILSSAGSGPGSPGIQVCVDIYIQADGEVN
jgi:hypothetical protein